MIYIVEDDGAIRELIRYTLDSQVTKTRGFEKPSDFWAELDMAIPKLIILDIMLPEENGLAILRRLRREERTKDIPILMLSAKASEFDRVVGLDSGADDYLPKPFGMMELVSRVKALLRRFTKDDEELPYQGIRYTVGCLLLSTYDHTLKVEGEEIHITRKEWEMLLLLLDHQGAVITRDQFLQRVWGYEFDGENRTVDVHIRTLRTKLGKAGDYIKTIRGVGYKLTTPDEE